VVHDNREGFDIIKEATDVEFYGNVIFNNGQVDTVRGHGHGLYLQNDSGNQKSYRQTSLLITLPPA